MKENFIKSRLIATAGILIAWMALDFLFHGVWLMSEYAATASLWRPMAEMKNGLLHVTSFVAALSFVLIFCNLVQQKSLHRGIKLGVLVGLICGIGAGLGSYAYMPITATIATGWFLANLVKFSVAGAITGFLVKTEMK